MAILPLLLSLAVTDAPVSRPEALLPAGARILQRLETDLDGDGRRELILAGGVEEEPGDGRSFSGEFEVRVLAPVAGGWRDAGKLDLVGLFEPVVVGDVGDGSERVRVLLASARQCGASCAGVEVQGATLRGGRLVPIGDPKEPMILFKGDANLSRRGFLETWTREDQGGTFVECCPDAYRVERSVVRGDRWVAIEAATVLAEEQARVRAGEGGPILSKDLLAARDWLVRPGLSVGKVALGLDVKGVHAMLGKPADERAGNVGGRVIHRWGDRNPLLIWFDEGRAVQIAVTSSRFATGRGLRAGAPLAEVRRRYDALRPSPGPTLLDTFSGIAFLVASGPEGGDDRKVRALVVHGDQDGAEVIPFELPSPPK